MTSKETKKDVPVSEESKEIRKSTPARALSPFEEMEREMERVFDRFGHGWMHPFRWRGPFWSDSDRFFEERVPRVDVIDRDEDILVRAELPGVDKKDLDVSMTDNTVTIKGSSRSEKKEEEGDYFRREVSSGSFSRTVSLPAEVDGAKSKASFKDGLLELTLPKLEKKKRHTIKVD